MKLIKNPIITFILGIIITSGIGVAAYNYNASNIEFTPRDENWNVNNVGDAINSLKSGAGMSKPVLLWTNPSPTSNFGAQTISLDLSGYKYVIVIDHTQPTNKPIPYSSVIVPIGNFSNYIMMGNTANASLEKTVRGVKATTTGVEFTVARWGGDSPYSNWNIPYKIYGVKEDLGLDLGI